jgi:DNA primase
VSRYTADSRDRVRDAVDMVSLVGTKVDLRRAGVNSYFGCCPFHDERTASFHVSPDEKLYHCFGCSESGDPFDYVMQTEGLDFTRAMESLADRFGVTLELEDEDPAAAAARARRERMYSLLHRTAGYYERCLWESGQAANARAYLLERGFTEETLREFRIGFSPDAWDRLLEGSRKSGFSDEELLAAGLIRDSQKRPGKYFDFFRGKVMFPILDARGRVRGFGARRMGEQTGPKYVNTPDGDLYHKREVLYGISVARSAAAKAGRMILAEGYTDVMALHQAGVKNAVGIMGTSLTREQVAELVRVVGTLELCLDADRAGQDAMVRAASLCADSGLELRVVPLPVGADPGDLIRTEGAPALRARIATSVPFVVFEVGRVLDRADLSSAEGKDRAIADLRPAFAGVPASVLRDELVLKAAGALGLDEARFVTLLGEGGAPQARGRDHGDNGGWGGGPGGPPPTATDRGFVPRVELTAAVNLGIQTERSYLSMCLAAGDAGELELGRIDPDELFTSSVFRRAAKHLAGRVQTPLAELPSDDDELARTIAELLDRAGQAKRDVDADQLEHARLLLELARIDRAIAHARAESTPGIVDLAWQRKQIRDSLADAYTRMEKLV